MENVDKGRVWFWALLMWAVCVVSLAFTRLPRFGADQGLVQLSVTPESLTMILAGLLAVIFDWFPGLSPWYGALSRLKKQQMMIILLALIVSAVFAGTCAGWFETGFACSRQSLPQLLQYVLAAAGANQAVHLLTRP